MVSINLLKCLSVCNSILLHMHVEYLFIMTISIFLQAMDVLFVEDDTPVKFSMETILYAEKYEIV